VPHGVYFLEVVASFCLSFEVSLVLSINYRIAAFVVNEELLKIFTDFSVSALGFTFALLVNSFVGIHRDKKAYHSMLAAIRSEARSNKIILNKSFKKYFQTGVVLREFSIETAAKYSDNILFVKNAPSVYVQLLNEYLRNIRLANAYRKKAELIFFNKEDKKWSKDLTIVWQDNLEECEKNIDRIIELI
jgi:hypothetical protein